MEIVEHVEDIPKFINQSTKFLKNNGLMFIATLNQTLKSYLFAIIGAEYILRWLPIGTHDWNKFLTPEDLYSFFIQNNFDVISNIGVNYNPLRDEWFMSKRMDANFIVSGKKN